MKILLRPYIFVGFHTPTGNVAPEELILHRKFQLPIKLQGFLLSYLFSQVTHKLCGLLISKSQLYLTIPTFQENIVICYIITYVIFSRLNTNYWLLRLCLVVKWRAGYITSQMEVLVMVFFF